MKIKVNGANLYYEEFGKGDRYILSACALFDPERKGWPYDLADEGFHVFAIQMRGYGESDHVLENLGDRWYDLWAEDVAAFAGAMGIPRFLYTGASDGGGIGWHLCLRYPKLLIGFAGIAAGPHSRSVDMSPGRKHTIDAVGSQAAVEQLAQYNKNTILYFAKKFADNSELKAEFERKAEWFYHYKRNMSQEEMRIQPGIPLPWLKSDEEVREALSSIHFPVLLFIGMKDAMLPLSKAIQPIDAIENAKAVFYQEANHRLYYGRRDDVRREISSFAREAFSECALYPNMV